MITGRLAEWTDAEEGIRAALSAEPGPMGFGGGLLLCKQVGEDVSRPF